MARIVRAVARPATRNPILSQFVFNQPRRLPGNVEPGARLGHMRRSPTLGQQSGLISGASPETERIHLQTSVARSRPEESLSKKISSSFVPCRPLSFKNRPSAGAIGGESPVPSPPVSSSSAVSDEEVTVKQGRLAGRKCLVTGATSGIGKFLSIYICWPSLLCLSASAGYAIARRFFEEGVASVLSVSRSQENINAAYESMKRHTNREYLPFDFLLGDITDPGFLSKHSKVRCNPPLVYFFATCILGSTPFLR